MKPDEIDCCTGPLYTTDISKLQALGEVPPTTNDFIRLFLEEREKAEKFRELALQLFRHLASEELLKKYDAALNDSDSGVDELE